MLPDRPPSTRTFQRVMTASVLLVIVAWSLLSIAWKFHVARLNAHEGLLSALFLLGLGSASVTWSVRRRGWRSLRSGLLRLALSLVVATIAFVAAELAARFIYRNVRTSGDTRDYFAQRGGGPSIRVNSLGFREREIGPATIDRYRIVVIGDSFTFGQGLEERERFSNVLERHLGPRYEVLNFGAPGNNLPEHVAVLERALDVAPDFVLLQLYINDFEMPEMERPNPVALLPWPSLDGWLLRSSVMYVMATRQWRQVQGAIGVVESYGHYMARNLRDPNAPNSRAAFGTLRQFIERARRAHLPTGVVLFPSPESTRNYEFAYLHDRARETCADENIPMIDLLGPFSAAFKDPSMMWVSPFDQHPNARANEKAAQQILAGFAELWRR